MTETEDAHPGLPGFKEGCPECQESVDKGLTHLAGVRFTHEGGKHGMEWARGELLGGDDDQDKT